MIDWKAHIINNPDIQFGKPVIRNTRITVELILEKLAEGETIDQIMESHPHISEESVYACLAYFSHNKNTFSN